MTTRTVEGWDQVLAAVDSKLAAAEAEQARLATEAGALALPATLGDRGAGTRLAKLDDIAARSVRYVALLRRAREDAGQERAAVVAADAAARRQKNLERAQAIALQVLQVDQDKIAAGLALLVEGFAERQALVLQLRPLGQLDSSRHRKLANKTMLYAALHHAGLGVHMPLDPVSPHHRQSLATWDSKMLADLLPPAPAPDPAPVLEVAA